jgi:hypothetical protein
MRPPWPTALSYAIDFYGSKEPSALPCQQLTLSERHLKGTTAGRRHVPTGIIVDPGPSPWIDPRPVSGSSSQNFNV